MGVRFKGKTLNQYYLRWDVWGWILELRTDDRWLRRVSGHGILPERESFLVECERVKLLELKQARL